MAKKSKRDELVYIEDILKCIDKLEEYVSDITEEQFEANSEKQDAVIRRIEIIGEAAKNISKETREHYNTIPWKEMAGMRDIVIHQYFGVSSELIWRVATSEIPELKDTIYKILKDFQEKL